jgi:hypothetical protein
MGLDGSISKCTPSQQVYNNCFRDIFEDSWFCLFQAYPKYFTKILNALSREFIDRLKSQNDPDSNLVISNLETYLISQQFRKEPEGRALAITDESKSLRA